MNKVFLAVALICGLAAGCDTASDDGTGGAGGAPIIGPLLWRTPGYNTEGDNCVPPFLVTPDGEPLAFNITIQGNEVVMIDADPMANPDTALQASTDTYTPEANSVRLTNSRDDDSFEQDFGCIAQLNDAFTLVLDDPDLSLDLNDTVQVTWTHDEADISTDPEDACAGPPIVWWNGLPCASEATFTLTQQVE